VLSELLAVSLLAPGSVFLVAFINCGFILADVLLQPKSSELSQLMSTSDAYVFIIRPIAEQAIVAIVTFLWVRSALQSLLRADRAEVVAELLQKDADQKQQLEAGIQELLAVHTQVANGNFHARSNASRGSVLWLISTSLNNLVGRMQEYAQAGYVLQRTRVEVHRLVEAFTFMRPGQSPVWPAPSDTPLDELLVTLRRIYPGSGTAGGSGRDAQSVPPPASPALMQPSQWDRSSSQGPRDLPQTHPESDIPSWLRQQLLSDGDSMSAPISLPRDGAPGEHPDLSYGPNRDAFDQQKGPRFSPGDDPTTRR
jgi:hypothetical protein